MTNDVIPKVKMKEHKTYKTIKSYTKLKSYEEKIVNYMLESSKGIYNSTLFHFKFFQLFKHQIYDDIYKDLLNNKLKITRNNINDVIKDKTNSFYNFYIRNKYIRHKNTQIIYPLILKYVKKNPLYNFNFKSIQDSLYIILSNKVNWNKDNINFVYTDIIDNILGSLYRMKFFKVKYNLLNKEKFTEDYDERFIDHVKSDRLIDFNKGKITKKDVEYFVRPILGIEYDKNGKLLSPYTVNEQNIIERLIYKNLSNKCTDVSSDLRINIMKKTFSTISAYYASFYKGYKPNFPKYLGEEDYYTLPFIGKTMKDMFDKYRLTLGYGVVDKFIPIPQFIWNKFQMPFRNSPWRYGFIILMNNKSSIFI